MKIAVVGAGASGMLAAITAAKFGAEVTCFEQKDKIGKKLYATGNGKCNFSNLALKDPDYSFMYPDADNAFLQKCFEQFGVTQICDFFADAGLLYTEKDGYLYPYSGQASTIVNLLSQMLSVYHITVLSEIKVIDIKKRPDDSFVLRFEAGENAPKKELRNHAVFDRVILACGGKAYPSLGSDGSGYNLAAKLNHRSTTLFPSLCGIQCAGDYWIKITGVRSRASVCVQTQKGDRIVTDIGEVQFCKYGISGIPVFNISHIVGKQLCADNKIHIKIDFFPDYSMEQLEHIIIRQREKSPSIPLGTLFSSIMNDKLAHMLIEYSGKKKDDPSTKDSCAFILSLLKNFLITPTQLNSFDQAQVTNGGIPLTEITTTFSSKKCHGLYLCGELLDVDGICGGYNLQWAWTSGYLAGWHAAID